MSTHLGQPLGQANKGGVTTHRQPTEEERRQHYRRKAEESARAGEDVRRRFDATDLAWLYTADELDQLITVAEAVRDGRRQRQAAGDHRRTLEQTTNAVLAEWDAQRRTEAETEARRRLGWPKTGWPTE